MRLCKRIFTSIFVIIFAVTLGACSKSDNSQESQVDATSSKEQSKGEEVVINVAVGSFATSSVYSAKEQFEQEHSGVTINVVEIPFGSLYEKLCTSFATNTEAYDIAIYPSNWMSEFIQGNSIIPLDEYLAEKDNWDGLIDAYYDMQLYNDQTYAVPLDGDSIILYYRKDALEN